MGAVAKTATKPFPECACKRHPVLELRVIDMYEVRCTREVVPLICWYFVLTDERIIAMPVTPLMSETA